MEVNQAIHERRSISAVTEQVPETETIEKILEAARWAPNHHKTEPWHFYVLTGEGRDKLGRVYGQVNIDKYDDPDERHKEKAMARGLEKARRSPVVIVNVVEPDTRDHIESLEEIAACSCAVQNMLLTAHDLGLAAKWRTGKPNFHAYMKEAFNVSDQGYVLGYLYIGYPANDAETATTEKKDVADYTTWVRTSPSVS